MRRVAVLMGVSILILTGCDDDPTAREPEPTPSETASTATASPPGPTTPTSSRSPDRTEAPAASPTGGESPAGTAQTYIVAPQEPREVAVGGSAQFRVGATYGGDDELPARLFLGVVPCDGYDFDTSSFGNDETGGVVDGFDEDLGPRIGDVNGEPYENVDDIWPTEVHVQDGELTFTVTSSEAACGVPVVFEDQDGNGELNVDDTGTAAEPYGVGQVVFG